MAGLPWSKWFWADWRSDPGLRACTAQARGVWMDCLCIAAESSPTGYVLVNGRTPTTTDLARLTGEPEAVVQSSLEELERNGVFSRDHNGRIYNRRMVRDAKRIANNRKNGKMGGNPKLLKEPDNPSSVNPPDNPSDKAKKPDARSLEAKSETEPSAAEVVPLAPRARRASSYAFEGRVIRLTSDDFERWRTSFHGIPDLAAELTVIDIWLFDRNQSEGWFHRTAGMLNRKHQELQAQKQETAKRPWERPWTIGVG